MNWILISPLVLALYAVVLGDNDQWEKAFEYVEKAIAIDPFNFFAHHILEFISYELGNTHEYIKAVRFIFPFEKEVFSSIEKTSQEKGLQAAFEETISHLETIQESSFLVPVHMASRYSRIHQYDKLLDQLEMGFQIHDQNMPYIATGFNKLTPVYKDPRFIALMEELNLPMPED